MRLITPTERIALKTAYDRGNEIGHGARRCDEARETLLELGEERLGACPPDVRSRIESIHSRELLVQLRRKLASVESWEELPIP